MVLYEPHVISFNRIMLLIYMHAYWVQLCDLMVEISEECYRLQTTTAAGVHVLVVPSVLLSGYWCLEQESLTVPSDQWLVVLLNGLWHFDQNP